MLQSPCGSQIMLCLCKILAGNFFKPYFLLRLLSARLQKFPLKGRRAGGSVGSSALPRASHHFQISEVTVVAMSLRNPSAEGGVQLTNNKMQSVNLFQITNCRVSIYSFCFYVSLGGNSSTNLDWRDEECWGAQSFHVADFLSLQDQTSIIDACNSSCVYH